MFKKSYLILIVGVIFIVGLLFFVSRNFRNNQNVLGEKTTDDNHEVEMGNYTEEDEVLDNEEAVEKELEILAYQNRKEEPKYFANSDLYEVVKVVDGDTVDVLINGEVERLRLIGINTPESVDPRKPVECFGIEASNRAKELLEGQKVYLEKDDTQDNRDKYDRLLRYIWREDGLFYNLEIIKQGYAYEYTYQIPYTYQDKFKVAEEYARKNKLGLWADGVCQTEQVQHTEATSVNSDMPEDPNCIIKGNINSKDEKIYHFPGCQSYANTKINSAKGERYFCSKAEAEVAGWRKAGNCP